MKIRKLMAMAIAAVALCAGISSCSNDDNSNGETTAPPYAGNYTGDLNITVMGQTSTDNNTIYTLTKTDDTHMSMTIPAAGSGAMALPSITLENIPVTTTTLNDKSIVTGKAEKLSGTITVGDAEKSYTINDLAVMVSGTDVSIVYSLQYGKMPMAMNCSFTGKK